MAVKPSIYSHPTQLIKKRAQTIYKILFKLYGQAAWQMPATPLDELMSTILSQNTNDRNRDKAFHKLKESFPTWELVRDAPLQDVVNAIRSGGLANQKGSRMQVILKQVSQEIGRLALSFLAELKPAEARQWLLRFKGVGPKTASIVMQFSLQHPAFPVDTHIYRVTGRLGLRPAKFSVEKTHLWMEELFNPEQYGPGHLNFIRHGRGVCHSRNPECPHCPLKRYCTYYHQIVQMN
jgi:endonuclease III